MKTRMFLFLFVVFVNFSAFLYYSMGGENSNFISGTDGLGFDIYVLNLFLMLAVLVFILTLYSLFEKINLNFHLKVFSGRKHEQKAIAGLVFSLQSFYLYFIWGAGSVAGAEDVLGGGAVGAVVAAFQILSLALVYLVSVVRRDWIWWVNLSIYIIINLYQGWSSFIFCLFLVFLFSREREVGSIQYGRVISFAVVFILFFYPVIYWFRLKVRMSGQQSMSFSDTNVLDALNHSSFVEFSFYAYLKLLERFEQYYLSLGSLVNRSEIIDGFDGGMISKIYQEGPLKYIFSSDSTSLGNYLPRIFYENVGLAEYYWNVSPGIVAYTYSGWLDFCIAVLMLVFVVFISAFATKVLDANKVLSDLVFFNLIFLLSVGWVSQYLFFIYSVFVFILINLFLKLFFDTLRRV